MAPSRRISNGRSPLVNQQRQITSFFSKTTSRSRSPSHSPSPSPTISKKCPKLNPNPNPNPNAELCPNRSPSPSPTTPSPLQSKSKKPLLVIGQTPSPPAMTPSARVYGSEVLGRRIRVYWPLDQAWYEGCLDSFDKKSGKHLVQYDDGDEESLDLAKEKIEWVEKNTGRFKRLRRKGSLAFKKVVIDEDDEAGKVEEEGESDGDDSSDDDWGKNVKKEASEDIDEELVDSEEEEDEDETEMMTKKRGAKNESRKRKATGVRLEVGRKDKFSRAASNSEFLVSEAGHVRNTESK